MNETSGNSYAQSDPVSRREVLEKSAKYMVFTAASMMTILQPRETLATSEYHLPADIPVDNSSPASRPVYPVEV